MIDRPITQEVIREQEVIVEEERITVMQKQVLCLPPPAPVSAVAMLREILLWSRALLLSALCILRFSFILCWLLPRAASHSVSSRPSLPVRLLRACGGQSSPAERVAP